MMDWDDDVEFVPTWPEVFVACGLMSIPILVWLFHALLDWYGGQ